MNPQRLLSFFLMLFLFSAEIVIAHELDATIGDAVFYHDDGEFWNSPEENQADESAIDRDLHIFACRRATSSQLATVNRGNAMLQDFLKQCASQTGHSPWCQEVTRPNPSSISTFRCTYGESQPHRLIHPDTSTWQNAFQAVRLVEGLQAKRIKVCQIYNWWRPEPYNANVGGAPGRHPFGTSVDVRFCSMADMEKAFLQLCQWRKEGYLRALGYYGSTGLHLGVGDATANTWGKNCPR